MDVKQIAEDVVAMAMAKAGQGNQVGEKYWADDVVSIEPMDGPMARLEGIAAVREKTVWWEANHQVNDLQTYGPFVNGDQFAVRWVMDVTMKANGERMQMEEIALYTIRDGKIAEEKFLY